MPRLTSILRYLWDGLGGQMAEVSFTLTGKIPAQITLAGLATVLVLILAVLLYLGIDAWF